MHEENLSISDRVDILKHIDLTQHSEVMYRREREFKIFTWSSTVLMGLIGALLIVKQTENPVWGVYGVGGRAAATFAVVLVATYSVTWQRRQRRILNQNAKVFVRISKLLHCFDVGYFGHSENSSLFPEGWSKWGQTKTHQLALPGMFLRPNKISVTAWLAILAIAMIWFS